MRPPSIEIPKLQCFISDISWLLHVSSWCTHALAWPMFQLALCKFPWFEFTVHLDVICLGSMPMFVRYLENIVMATFEKGRVVPLIWVSTKLIKSRLSEGQVWFSLFHFPADYWLLWGPNQHCLGLALSWVWVGWPFFDWWLVLWPH